MGRKARATATLILALVANRTLVAQGYEPTKPRNLVVGNIAIGGVTAAVQAAVRGDNVGKALLVGALGGAVHGAGKALQKDIGLAAVGIGSIGTSIVANAGRGAHPLDAFVFPIGPARLRLTPNGERKVQASLNLYETAYLASTFMRPGMRLDWNASQQSATFVFRTPRRLLPLPGPRAAGLTTGSVILLNDFASHPKETLNHERVHLQQGWFLQETWGRPIENDLRERTALLRWIPGWLELGIVTPALFEFERQAIGPGALIKTFREREAETIESWGKR